MSDLWGLHTAADSYPSGDQVDASAVISGVRRLADFAHRTHPGAAAFLGMTPDEQFDHFNTHLAPLYEQHGLPVPGVGRWLDFTDAVKEHWSGHHTASTDGVRYAHLVEADVAEDLMRVAASGDPSEEDRLRQEAARNEVNFHSTRHQDKSPYGQHKNQLYDQFMTWWPTSRAAQENSPETSSSNWVHYPHEPVVHWPNVEAFLEEIHPDSATRSALGREEAQRWEGTPVTQAFLGLHNAVQGRTSLADDNEYDYYRLLRKQGQRLAARPKRIKPPWSDFHNGQAYPLQNQSTADLTHMFYSLRDAHQAGEPPADGVTPFADRIPHYEAELLDRHEAGDPEATRWADRGSYIKPDYMDDAQWQDSRRMYPEDYPVDPRPPRRRKPTAAVTQDLVDRLNHEFHQWWPTSQGPEVQSHAKYGDPDIGPISHWPAIEGFLRDRYPAAHKGHEMGLEESARSLDGLDPMPYQQRGKADLSPYETGPDAIATHGYDPAEIAASMVLLHNQAHPLRADMEQRDQDRLTDIYTKRTQMQRDYEQRTKTAMPYYHYTDQEFAPGDELKPATQTDPSGARSKWGDGHDLYNPSKVYFTWRDNDPGHDEYTDPNSVYGPHAYEVEPVGEVEDDPEKEPAREWHLDNLGKYESGDLGHDDYMAPNAIVKRKIEAPQVAKDHAEQMRNKHSSHLAMPMPLPKGVTFTPFGPGDDLHREVAEKHNMDAYAETWDRMSGVAAHLNGNQVGHLVWFHPGVTDIGRGGKTVDVGNEVGSIKVNDDLQHHSVATGMWDYARSLNPDLRHSPVKTQDGRGWADYEQNRHA